MKSDKFTREEISKILRNNSIVSVNFLKKNGQRRKMLCTLDTSMIPVEDHPNGNSQSFPENQMRVYDVEAQGWRSFLIDRVQEIEGA